MLCYGSEQSKLNKAEKGASIPPIIYSFLFASSLTRHEPRAPAEQRAGASSALGCWTCILAAYIHSSAQRRLLFFLHVLPSLCVTQGSGLGPCSLAMLACVAAGFAQPSHMHSWPRHEGHSLLFWRFGDTRLECSQEKSIHLVRWNPPLGFYSSFMEVLS